MLIKGSLKDRQTIVYHASVVWFPNDYVQVNGIDTIMPHNKEGKNHKEKTKKTANFRWTIYYKYTFQIFTKLS